MASSTNKSRRGADSGNLVSRFLGAILPSPETRAAIRRWTVRCAVGVAALAILLGSWEIRRRVVSQERFYLNNWSLEIVDLPEWVTPEIRAEIESFRLGSDGSRFGLFERGVLLRVKGAIERVPWIAQVSEISLGYPRSSTPGVVELGLRLRTPVALVEHGGLYYLTDAEAVRLGAPYKTAPTDWFRVPAIVSIPFPGPLADEGQKWSSRDVLQGISVAAVLHQSGIGRDFPRNPVERIDLANLHGRINPRSSEIALWADGRRYTWGRSPISSGPRVVPVESLVAALRQYLSDPRPVQGLREVHLDSPGLPTGVRG